MFVTPPSVGRLARGPALALVGLAICASGCTREALPEICPVVDEGELVISELRGDQSGDDTYGHYIEVYNAAGKTVDLEGMRVRLRDAGGDVVEILVRESVEVAAGDYAVIGPGDPDPEVHESWIDYAIGWDISGGDPADDRYPNDFLRFDSAFVELEACGELIDTVFYGSETLGSAPLTDTGTMACGNASSPPDASANDNLNGGCWCVDDLEAEGQPLFGIGLPGTPGGANRCP